MRFILVVFLVPALCLSGCVWLGVASAEETARHLTAAETEQMRTLQERMMSDTEIMAQIQALQSDPEMQELLKDPSVLNAVTTGDITTLTGNPRFMRLLENARVKDIQRRLKP
jgi:hypothetical protein